MSERAIEAAIAAVVADLRGRMPAITEMPADLADMGPDVTLPVVHMHLLLEHIRFLEAGRILANGELTIARVLSVGPVPEDVGDAQAVHAGNVGDVVVRAHMGDYEGAVWTLIYAAAAILATKHEASFAARALETGAKMMADDIRRQFTPRGALQ